MAAARAFGFLWVLVLLVPYASAEWGVYGADGWPIDVNGQSTNPFPGITADQLDAALVDGDPLNRVGDTTVFPYWPLLLAEVQRMAQDHPDRVRLSTAGKSTLGLDLFMMEIADFDALAAGTALPLEDREVVWVDGGTHSNEYSGVYFALAWAQFLVEEFDTNETAKWIVENRHTWIMPMVNPDGSNLFGRLNANRVNINRNYPVIWDGVGHDELLNNRGPSPASEIETRINIDWFNRTRPDYYATVHCCGNLWLYPYGEEGIDPIDQSMLSRVCDEAFAIVRSKCGPIWSTIYPASGSSVDTAYEYTGTVAFGFEMSGRGAVSLWGQPVTFEDVMAQEFESWQGLEHAFLNVHRYGALPVVTGVGAVPGGIEVTLRNDGLGNLSGATIEVWLAPGEDASVSDVEPGNQTTVVVPAAPAMGERTVQVHYSKRLVSASNRMALDVPILLTHDPDAVAPAGGFVVGVPKEGAIADAETPGPPAALILIGVVVAMAGLGPRRRRRLQAFPPSNPTV